MDNLALTLKLWEVLKNVLEEVFNDDKHEGGYVGVIIYPSRMCLK